MDKQIQLSLIRFHYWWDAVKQWLSDELLFLPFVPLVTNWLLLLPFLPIVEMDKHIQLSSLLLRCIAVYQWLSDRLAFLPFVPMITNWLLLLLFVPMDKHIQL